MVVSEAQINNFVHVTENISNMFELRPAFECAVSLKILIGLSAEWRIIYGKIEP